MGIRGGTINCTLLEIMVSKISYSIFLQQLKIRHVLLWNKNAQSSSSSSSIFHVVGPLVDPFRSHASRSLFNGLPWFLLPVGEYCFITFGNLLRGILFTCCIQFLLYSCSLSRIGVMFISFAICLFVLWSVQGYPAVLLMYFICAVVILPASLALMVQDSLPYNNTGRASVLYNFNLVFLRDFAA